MEREGLPKWRLTTGLRPSLCIPAAGPPAPAPHLLLNSVLLSHDGFIIGKTVNTWKKEEGHGLQWASALSTPGSRIEDKNGPGQETRLGIWEHVSHTQLHPTV